MLLGWPFLAAVTLATQSPQSPPPQRRADPPPAAVKSIAATRAAQPPVIDGRDDDAVWRDAQIYNDGNEDFAWDAVWDVATRVDSLGWTAEYRIPLTQLPYGRQRTHTFGFTVDRDVYRYAQRVSWPLFRQSQAGFVSQFGEVTGLEGLEAPRRLEAAPDF